MTYVNKAGWLYKRGRFQRRWVRRWFSVNSHKCSFKYCDSPGPVSSGPPLIKCITKVARISPPPLRGTTMSNFAPLCTSTPNTSESGCGDVGNSVLEKRSCLVTIVTSHCSGWHHTVCQFAQALDCGKSVLSGKIVSASSIHQPCKREGVMVSFHCPKFQVFGEMCEIHCLTLRDEEGGGSQEAPIIAEGTLLSQGSTREGLEEQWLTSRPHSI